MFKITFFSFKQEETFSSSAADNLTKEDILLLLYERKELQREKDRLTADNHNLRKERDLYKEKLGKKSLSPEAFSEDPEMLKYYIGIPNFELFRVLFLEYVAPKLPSCHKRKLSPFDMIIACLMRLRLDLPFQHIGYMLDVHLTTVSASFKETIGFLYNYFQPFVLWPDRQELQKTMPHQFKNAFGNRVAIIIDCFEIFIEKPSNVHARALTWSNYKHAHTYKYLIGITPNGNIAFISKGWGGRAGDKQVTEESGFLNKLVPGDLILADRGFNIEDSVGLMCAEVKLPAFARGMNQMQAKSLEETRKLAHLRIHVERVIGSLCNRFSIFQSTQPAEAGLACDGQELSFLDKMVFVCCALTNVNKGIVVSV